MGGHEMEFGGVVGAGFMMAGLPAAVYLLNMACSKEACTILEIPAIPNRLSDYLDLEAAAIFLGWFVFQLVLYVLPTGSVVEGLPLSSGKRLPYRCNAFLNLVLSLLGFAALVYLGYPVTVVYDKFLQIATAAILFSLALSVFLYAKSFTVTKGELAPGGDTGYFLYDFFIGRELNPRVGPVDLKFFCELRPGLIGWVILDLCFIVKATEVYGSPPLSLLIVSAFHAFYVADALWFEDAILSTMDIVHDGFGFMLAFGDLAWVPFLYSLQARFLLEHRQTWSHLAIIAFCTLNAVGYYIFRGSNGQKNEFRKNPENPALSNIKTMSTASGRKLLISGWWGMCRHPNYLGDLLMALSWSLPCGFSHILPYFYPIYFLGLLVHRFERDDINCQKKYGKDWDRYCSIVKYKIFPYIY